MNIADEAGHTRVLAAASGDREAFGALVAAHQSMVASVAYGITGDLRESEDIAQEVFLTAWQRLRQLREPARLGPWLAAIARNRAKDALRRRARDPLAGASPVAAGEGSANPPNAQGSMVAEERAAMLWEMVSALPEGYRAVLVLYYREGASIRLVAERLGLTEHCARKRLSRARGILRDRMTAQVEDTLRTTRPGETFTLAVLASLPVAGAQASVAGAASAAGVLAKGASTGGAGVFSAAGAGLLGGLAGAVAGMTGGFFGMWMSIRNAATLAERRCVIRNGAWFYAMVWIFLGYEGWCGVLLWERPGVLAIAAGLGWVVYMPILYLAIVRGNAQQLRLRRAAEEDDESVVAPGIGDCRRSFLIAFPVAVAGSLGMAAWLGTILPGGVWLGAGFLLFSHVGYAAIHFRGMRIAEDEAIFLETAPAVADPAGEYAHPETIRASVLNDALGLAGGVLGASAFIYVSLAAADAGVWAVALVTFHLSVLAVAAQAMRWWPRARGGATLLAMTASGCVNAVAILVYPLPWLAAFGVGDTATAMPLVWRIMTAGITLGMFVFFGWVGRVLIHARDGVRGVG